MKAIEKINESISQDSKLLDELINEMDGTYQSVKDFTVDSVTTDKAIKKMQSINTQITKVSNRIKKNKKLIETIK